MPVDPETPPGDLPMAHFVFFTLRDGSPAAQQALIDACHRYLSGHDGTVYFSAGPRVAAQQRAVNDQEFHVALHLVFESKAAHDAYQIAPRHDEFIATQKANWAQVRVFDSFASPAVNTR